jgi:hypothetical protein
MTERVDFYLRFLDKTRFSESSSARAKPRLQVLRQIG